ncbi:hypothetical protein KA082_02975, partial [Candidatus Woesebacteria bacterium]|nr:hypothetical protein [Candidatus Woesebacteria bacterium]
SSGSCRLTSNTASSTCQPATTPTPTPTPGTPTPTPTPVVGCNDTCSANADCSNSAHICYSNQCRLADNVESETCSSPTPEVTPTPVMIAEQPALPEELPQTGPSDWINWLKAGLVTLGIGATLLLLL